MGSLGQSKPDLKCLKLHVPPRRVRGHMLEGGFMTELL